MLGLETYINIDKLKNSLKLLPNYIRINMLKISPKEFLEIFPYEIKETPIPFVFELIEKISIGRTPEFQAGYIHAQSLSSAIVPLAFSSLNKQDIVLDAAAAPGGKTSEMAALMKNEGAIIANDRKERQRALMGTLKRLGVFNTVITNYDMKSLPYKEFFTKALLDAPCSALGSWLNAWKRLENAPNIPDRLSSVQNRGLNQVIDAVKPGGEIIYSTCTITAEENEAVVDAVLEERRDVELEEVKLPVKHDKGLKEFSCADKVARIYPWHVNSEAFFIAKIKKRA